MTADSEPEDAWKFSRLHGTLGGGPPRHATSLSLWEALGSLYPMPFASFGVGPLCSSGTLCFGALAFGLWTF